MLHSLCKLLHLPSVHKVRRGGRSLELGVGHRSQGPLEVLQRTRGNECDKGLSQNGYEDPYCYCLLLLPIAIAYCHCLLPLPIAISVGRVILLCFLFGLAMQRNHLGFTMWLQKRQHAEIRDHVYKKQKGHSKKRPTTSTQDNKQRNKKMRLHARALHPR